jgi:hypothetical protein
MLKSDDIEACMQEWHIEVQPAADGHEARLKWPPAFVSGQLELAFETAQKLCGVMPTMADRRAAAQNQHEVTLARAAPALVTTSSALALPGGDPNRFHHPGTA